MGRMNNPYPKPSPEDFEQAPKQSGWTPVRTAVMQWLWAEGLSCAQIANRVGGLTRNAVIGKTHRLKMIGPDGRPKASPPGPVAPRETRGFGIPAKDAAKPAPKPAEPRPTAPRVAIAGNGTVFETAPDVDMPKLRIVTATGKPARIVDDHFGGCKWPISDPGRGCMEETLFCCGPREVGNPYCASHSALATTGQSYSNGKKVQSAKELARSLRRYI